MGISCWIAHKAVWSPQNPAVRFRERQINYPEFESRIAHLAGYLSHKCGVSEGDRVAYLGKNHPAILDTLFACARLGAIFVPLNARLTPSQLALMLENADPTCLIAGPDFRSVAESCQVLRPQLALIHLQDPHEHSGDALDLDALTKTESAIACNPNRNQNIPVLIAYTSGTTGTPKGAVFTQDALTFTAINSNNVWNMRGRDHVLTYLPMFHVGGLLIHTLPAFHIGAAVTIQDDFDPASVLAEIGTNGISLILAPPTFSRALSSHPNWAATDLTGLRCVGIGSTFVSPEIMQPWFDRDVPTQQNYGLTEGVPILASPWEHARRKCRVGSSNVYPADLEKVLGDCPEIAEAAVVGCPDPETGEALVACVKLREDGGLDQAGIRALFVGRLAEYQYPKHVMFMDEFPRTSLGKIQKVELARLVRDAVAP